MRRGNRFWSASARRRARGAFAATLHAVVLLLAASARADDVSPLEELLDDTVVTTASKSIETGSVAPATSTILTAEDLRRYGIHSLDEAINFLSLGMFTSDPLREADIGGRGVIIDSDFGDHVTLLVNGHGMNEPLFGSARFDRGAGIPFEMIDHIEVILGPGSVLYGSNSMLGVINIITKRARDFDGAHIVAESEIAKSYRASVGFGRELTLFGLPLEVTAQAEYYDQHGPAFTYGPQLLGDDPTRPGYDILDGQLTRYTRTGPATGIWGGTAKNLYYTQMPSGIVRVVLGDLEVTLAGSIAKRGTPYWGNASYAGGDFDDPLNYVVDRRAWGEIKYHTTLTDRLDVSARAYADVAERTVSSVNSEASVCIDAPRAGLSCLLSSANASRWVGTELQASLDWFHDARFVSRVGTDARAAFVGSKSDETDPDTGTHYVSSFGLIDRHDETLGAYAQQIMSPSRWLDINVGARLDLGANYAAAGSPRAAASVKPWRGGTLKAVYAEAFRYPSWVELDLKLPTQQPSHGLVPERVRSFEASLEQKVGTHRLLFGAFDSTWKDIVGLHALTVAEAEAASAAGEVNFLRYNNFSQFRNIGIIDNFGFDALVEGSLFDARLHYAGTLTTSIAREDDQQPNGAHALTLAPRAFGNARIAYDLGGSLPTLALAGHWLGARPVDRAVAGGFPGVTAPPQLELRGTASGTVPVLPGLSYRVSANYSFASRGPYVVGPTQGRYDPTYQAELVPIDRFRVTLGLTYEFGRSDEQAMDRHGHRRCGRRRAGPQHGMRGPHPVRDPPLTGRGHRRRGRRRRSGRRSVGVRSVPGCPRHQQQRVRRRSGQLQRRPQVQIPLSLRRRRGLPAAARFEESGHVRGAVRRGGRDHVAK